MKILGATGLGGLWGEQYISVKICIIDETNTFQLKFFIQRQNCRSHRFGQDNTFQLKFLF